MGTVVPIMIQGDWDGVVSELLHGTGYDYVISVPQKQGSVGKLLVTKSAKSLAGVSAPVASTSQPSVAASANMPVVQLETEVGLNQALAANSTAASSGPIASSAVDHWGNLPAPDRFPQ
jgi:hypothetical protein